MPTRCRVGVVVVAWEDAEMTAACLSTLIALGLEEQQLSIELRIIVSDDASSVKIQAALQQAISVLDDSRVSLVCREQRGGYAAAANTGISALDGFKPGYIWILNNDIRVDPHSLVALALCASRSPEVLVWGSTVVSGWDGETLECAGGYRYSPLTTRNTGSHCGARLNDVEILQAEPLDYVAGAAMFCHADTLRKISGLCEDYFLYFEEQDLVKRLGGPQAIGWCRSSLVYHRGAASTGAVGKQRSTLQQYYENLSTFRFTARYYPALLPLVLITRLCLKPILFLARREWHLFKPFGYALLDFCLLRKPRLFTKEQ